MAEKPKPRFYEDYHASYRAKHDPSKRENVTSKPSCTFRDQNSDAGAGRTVTPKREAMWRNFSGSQAALLTGHAPTAHSGAYQPKLVPVSVAEQEAAAARYSRNNNNNNNSIRPSSPLVAAARRNSGSSQISNSGENINNNNNNNNDFSNNSVGLRSSSNNNNNNNKSSSSAVMRSHNASTFSQEALMEGARRNLISGSANENSRSNIAFGRSMTPQPQQSRPSPARHTAPGGLEHHWTMNAASTKVVPVENNSASITTGRHDSIVRSAPFPHHKNMVFPEEDPTVNASRDRLWMNRPLRNGQYTASRKRTYNMPTFRGSNDINVGDLETTTTTTTTTPRQSGSLDQHQQQSHEESSYTTKVSTNTGTSFLNNNNNVTPATNNNNNTSLASLHFAKKKVSVPTHLDGASGTVTEEINQHRFMVRPQHPREFKAPYNEERTTLLNAPPQEIPKAERVLGRRHLSQSLPSGIDIERNENGWSDQPVLKKTGPRFYPYNFGNSKDFPVSDEPPRPDELPKFRPSVVPLQGAPAFVPSISKNRASTPEPRSNSPGRRCQFTPRDHDIFGAKEQRQPWHPQLNQPSSISRAVELTAAPGSVDINRCRGVGTYSPVRVQPHYRF